MDSASPRRITRALDGLWHISSATSTLMVLLVLLAITVAAAAVLLPLSPSLGDAAGARSLASAVTGYGALGRFLQRLEGLTAFGSFWLRLLLVALAYTVALRIAVQARVLARDWHRPLVGLARRRLALAGSLLAYFGTLLLLSGLLVNHVAGWRVADIALAPGDRFSLEQANGFQVGLEEIGGTEPYQESLISLAWDRENQPIGMARVRHGRPARWGGLWIAQRAAGAALDVAAEDGRGRALLLQSLEPAVGEPGRVGEVSERIHLLFRQTQAEQAFALPTRNLAFRVVSYPALPDRGIREPVFLIEAYRGEEPTPVLSEFVTTQADLVLDSAEIHLRRGRYAILDAAYLPGLLPFAAGGLAIILGVLLALLPGPPPRTRKEAVGPTETPAEVPSRAG